MPGALSTWSTLHTSKTPRHPIPKPKPPYIMTTSSPQSPFDPLHTSSSRTTSLAGKKRPRDSDEGGKGGLTRRTKSTSDAWEGRSVKEREAFQRGLIAVFVPNALRESVRGTMTHYDELLAHFLPNPTVPVPPLPPLLHLVRTLTSHVSMLSPEIHSTLVSAIINLPWATGDEKFVKTYVGWAGVLVSAHPGWAKELATMAIRGLTWRKLASILSQLRSSGRSAEPACLEPSSSTVPLTRRIFHARHHLLLSHLLRLVPTLPNVLQPLLVRYFPNKREPEVMQTTWLRNSCEFIGYCPELRQRVWSEVIDKILRMDVSRRHHDYLLISPTGGNIEHLRG